MTDRTPMYSTLKALVPGVVGAVVLALAGLLAVRVTVPPAALREANDVVGNYLQTLGTIYAVLLAFVVFVVWQQFNDARAAVEREANDLTDLVRTVSGMPTELHRAFNEGALAYVNNVLDREWPAMASTDDVTLEQGGQRLEQLWSLLVAFEPCSECHKSLYDDALEHFNELSDARSGRVNSSRVRIPLALRLLLYAGGITTVASMYLFAVERLAVHALITGCLAAAISHVLYIISDLDDCFKGAWQVPRAPFEQVRRYVTTTLAAPLAPALAPRQGSASGH
jgi:hypothetical protein